MDNTSAKYLSTQNTPAPSPVATPTPASSTKPTLQEKLRSYITNPLLLFIVFIAIVIIVVVISLIVNRIIDSHDQKITVTNLGSYAGDLPTDIREDIYANVFLAAQSNSPDLSDESLSSASATIRDNTFTSAYASSEQIYSGSFIVDIPNLEQSYKVYYGWTKDSEKANQYFYNGNVVISCLTPDQYVYQFSPCISPGEDKNSAPLAYLENILPFTGSTDSGVAISVGQISYTTGGDPFLRVNINSCGNPSSLEAGLETFKQYIKDHQLNPDDYTFVTRDLCDGEAG